NWNLASAILLLRSERNRYVVSAVLLPITQDAISFVGPSMAMNAHWSPSSGESSTRRRFCFFPTKHQISSAWTRLTRTLRTSESAFAPARCDAVSIRERIVPLCNPVSREIARNAHALKHHRKSFGGSLRVGVVGSELRQASVGMTGFPTAITGLVGGI